MEMAVLSPGSQDEGLAASAAKILTSGVHVRVSESEVRFNNRSRAKSAWERAKVTPTYEPTRERLFSACPAIDSFLVR